MKPISGSRNEEKMYNSHGIKHLSMFKFLIFLVSELSNNMSKSKLYLIISANSHSHAILRNLAAWDQDCALFDKLLLRIFEINDYAH